MKRYIKSNNQSYDTKIASCGDYELRKDRNGKYFVMGPDGFVNFHGQEHPFIPDNVYRKFIRYIPGCVTHKTIEASYNDEDEYYIDDEYNITQSDWDEITSKPNVYGYHIHSTMTDIDIMVVSTNKHDVIDYGCEVYDLITNGGEFSELMDFCDDHNLYLVTDEDDNLSYISSVNS